jgi:2-polyprenyl-3-methyl-5-hydroxy-6-metoxy-1,4-benzoquinol methylase
VLTDPNSLSTINGNKKMKNYTNVGASGLGIQRKLNRHHFMFFKSIDVKGKKILDVGCGRGEFLEACKNKGALKLMGLDPDPQNVSFLHALNICVLNDLYDLNTNLNGFDPDLITMFEVIEHLYDPHPLIKAAYEHLKISKGSLFVSTPNAFNFMRLLKFSFHQRHHDTLMDPVISPDAQHIRGFSFGMVEDLLKMHGFINVRRISNRVIGRYSEQTILVAGDVD